VVETCGSINQGKVEHWQMTHFMIKKSILIPLAAMLSVAVVLTACQPPTAKTPSGTSAAQSTRNNSYSLLHQLLAAQQDVSMLRFIKREDSDVKILINKIAANSAAGAKLLEEFVRRDPSLKLDDLLLPPGEVATREAIAATKKTELLGQTGYEFEPTLLLTQSEALSYGWHLALVASKNESQPERARALAGVSKDMEGLYGEVFVMLLSKNDL
jgi:hypothetical protein